MLSGVGAYASMAYMRGIIGKSFVQVGIAFVLMSQPSYLANGIY